MESVTEWISQDWLMPTMLKANVLVTSTNGNQRVFVLVVVFLVVNSDVLFI